MAQSSRRPTGLLQRAAFVDSHFSIKRFTDLTIRCQGQEFFVHTMIMAEKSAFFNAACDPDSPWIEAKTGVIVLDYDHPDVVEAMLAHCYRVYSTMDGTFHYDEDIEVEFDKRPRRDAETELRFFVLLNAIGDKYQIVGLQEKVFERFEEMIDPYNALNNRYDLENARMNITPAGVGRILRDIFKTTREDDKFRKYFLCRVSLEINKFQWSSRFNNEVDNIDGFWKSLSKINIEIGYRERRCPSCNQLQEEDLRSFYPASTRCCHCNERHTLERWNEGNTDLDDDLVQDTDTEEEGIGEQGSVD
ncbi:hypothetical protein IWZ01DRAFT_529288 [Phyllosticta capitalensis]